MVEPANIQSAISFMLIGTKLEPNRPASIWLTFLEAQLSGTSLGLSLSGAIFQNRSIPLVADVLGPGYSREDVVGIISNIDPELVQGLSTELRRRIRDIVIQAVDDG